MRKDSYYFQHDYGARNDDKILELRSKYGVEGYGLFWMTLETMAENNMGGLKASLIGGLSINYGTKPEKLKEFLDYCVKIKLFYRLNGSYLSKRLLTHKEFRKMLSEKGKEGADSRWKK